MPHPKKGSPEAYAWAARMQAARKKHKKNPGAAWHRQKAEESAALETRAKKASWKDFYHGKEVAHFESELAARQEHMNPGRPHGTFRKCVKKVSRSLKKYGRTGDPQAICGAALSRKYKKNPITVLGINPPPRVVGVIYNRLHEIRAEKTHWKPGYYRHPFSRGSRVQVLALDNGDLLIHSQAGVKLWMPD